MPRLERPEIGPDALAEWCEALVGAPPASVLFETGHLSAVVGVTVSDGRRVVVKARPFEDRMIGCAVVHAHLWRAGYPCPEPLAGPAVYDTLAVNIEAYVPAGDLPSRSDAPALFAPPLARLVELAPPLDSLSTLEPLPAWVAWDGERDALWPAPDDRDDDLVVLREPAWIDEAAGRARRRLAQAELPAVVGHVDWWAANLLWVDRRLRAVVDWDSVAALPEPALVGVAAAIFPPTPPSVQESAAFVEAYQHARGRRFNSDELEVSWAAGTWTRTFDAKKESVDGPGPVQAGLAEEIDERLELAGA